MNANARWCSFGLGLALLASSSARAQCGLRWQPGQLPGTDASVLTSIPWDPDGNGPQPRLVVIGGRFQAVGWRPANRIAAYEPVTGQWSALGDGLDGEVRCIAALPNGELVAGGTFTHAGGIAAAHVARWDGAAWHPLGTGIAVASWTSVNALDVAPDGSLVAGGSFYSAGGILAANIARWNGTAWSAIGGGVAGIVRALEHLTDGSLVASGDFTQAGGNPASHIARWDGAAWSGLGSGIASSVVTVWPEVLALLVLPDGRLVAGGTFDRAGGGSVQNTCVWDGIAWTSIGSGVLPGVVDLELTSAGELLAATYVGASFGVIRWDGTWWTVLAAGANSVVQCITALPGSEFVAGGFFWMMGGQYRFHLARWNGGAWTSPVAGTVPLGEPPDELIAMPDGSLVAAFAPYATGYGPFQVARWDGVAWNAMTNGYIGAAHSPRFAVLANGDLVTAGNSSGMIQRWSGSAWVVYSTGSVLMGQVPIAMLGDRRGGLLVAGLFTAPTAIQGYRVARWDGASWLPLTSGPIGYVRSLVQLRNGDLVACGRFTNLDGVPAANIARHDGTSWHALGAGLDREADQMVVRANGDLIVAGFFTTAGGVTAPYVARWDGTTWHPFGSSVTPGKLASLPDGDVLAVARYGGGVPYQPAGLWRGDGSHWTEIPAMNADAYDVAVLPEGRVWVAGLFTNAGGMGAAYVASLASDCPATATAYGAGCASSVGPMALAAESLPWVGSVSSSLATGIAPNGLPFGLVGLATVSTPLSVLHPAGGPGCQALLSPIAATWLAATAGQAPFDVLLPDTPSLVGVVLRAQVIQGEFDALGRLSLLASTNGLALVLGAL